MSLNFPVSLCGCPPTENDVCGYQGGCEVLDPTITYLFRQDCSIIQQSGATSLAQSWGSTKNAYGIHIGSNLTTWGNSLFRSNPRLTSLYIPKESTQCGIYAFWGATDLETVTFGGQTHTFGSYSFRYCNNLTRLNFCSPGIVSGIQTGTYGAFSGLTGITEAHIPENGWGGNTTVNFGGTVGTIPLIRDLPPVTPDPRYTYTFSPNGNILKFAAGASIPYAWLNGAVQVASIQFGTNHTSTGDRAFRNCDALTSVEIPEWITLIDTYSFENCDNLTRVDIPRLGALPSAPGNPFYQSYPTIHLPVNHPTTATQYATRPIVKDLPAM